MTDLTIASFIDINIVSAISLFERVRFFFGAILIGLTATLSMYLNRLIPKNDLENLSSIYNTITKFTKVIASATLVMMIIFVILYTQNHSPNQIYGVGTAINIFLMFLSTPIYVLLLCSKKTKNIMKIGVFCTVLNVVLTWYFAKHLDLKTYGIIIPTVAANLISYYLFYREATKIKWFRFVSENLPKEKVLEIFKYTKHNMVSGVSICLSELTLIIVALKLGDIGVLYGVFFAFEKLFNSITNATANTSAILFSEELEKKQTDVDLKKYYSLSLINSFIVITLTLVTMNFYDHFSKLDSFLNIIIGIIFFNSIDYFLRKTVLRPSGDAEWTKKTNLLIITGGNFLISLVIYFMSNKPTLAAYTMFFLLLFQSFLSVSVVLLRVKSKRWYHEF